MTEMVLMVIVCLALLLCWFISSREREKEFTKERDLWHTERQQLLDRIQAPTYDHLKHHEAKIIKAQQPPKEEEKAFQLI